MPARLGCLLMALFASFCGGLFAAPPPEAANVFGLPEDAHVNSGALVLGGGGSLPEEAYDEFVRLAGGEKAELVLIPSAYQYNDAAHVRRVFNGWFAYDVASFQFFHTDDPKKADSTQFCRVLEKATGVWLGGGSQGRLVDLYGGRRVEKLLHRVLERGGVIGGTSAGASAQSKLMIRYSSTDGAVIDSGLGLTSRLVIDQHFSQRGRFPRLLGVIEEHPDQIGLGIDENTAVIVQGNRLRVLGDGQATLCLGSSIPEDGVRVHRISERQQGEICLTIDDHAKNRHYRIRAVDK